MVNIRTSRFVQFLLIIFFSSLVFQHNLNASTVRDTFKKNIDFKEGGFLSLSNSNGDIEIESWDKNEVEIIAYKRVKAEDKETAAKLMERLKIDIREHDGGIIIETSYPSGSSGGGL